MRVPGIPYVQGKNDYSDADGKKYGIAIHNTSNDASDEGEASYATRRTDGISSHFYCDKDSVTQSIDTKDRVGHAGSKNGNENAIAVEITGANAKTRQWWLANVAWDKLAQTLAYVIKNDPNLSGFQVRRASVAEMKANPKIKAFYSHDDMRRAWGGTTHVDPGSNFPWDHFLSRVKNALSPVEDDMSAEAEQKINALYDAFIGSKYAIALKAGDPKQPLAQVLGHAVYALVIGPEGSGAFIAGWTKAVSQKLGLTEEQLKALQSAVENVDEEVAAKLQGSTVEETANMLRQILGDKAQAVGALLSK